MKPLVRRVISLEHRRATVATPTIPLRQPISCEEWLRRHNPQALERNNL
jgi:hypothetical protein